MPDPQPFAISVGKDVQILISRLGQPAVKIEVITNLANNTPHQTFRIALADGTQWKVRQLPTSHEAAKVVSILLRLPQLHFPPVIDECETALLEPWIDGSVLSESATSDQTLCECGQVLASVHALDSSPFPSHRSPTADDRLNRMDTEMKQLLAATLLSPAEAQRLRHVARGSVPESSETRIVHRDFCAENLVLRNGIPVCIDNMSLNIGHPDEDLARTFYRWPMTAEQQEVFLGGYRPSRDTHGFLHYYNFWMATVLVHALHYRWKTQSPRIDEPLARIRNWLGDR